MNKNIKISYGLFAISLLLFIMMILDVPFNHFGSIFGKIAIGLMILSPIGGGIFAVISKDKGLSKWFPFTINVVAVATISLVGIIGSFFLNEF